MSSPAPLRIAVVADLSQWVLGMIARNMERLLSGSGTGALRVTAHAAPSPAAIAGIARHHDVIHFLSPWEFFHLRDFYCAPTVVTVNHLTARIEALLKSHHTLADVLCVPNRTALAQLSALTETRATPLFVTHYGLDTGVFTPRAEGRRRLLERLGAPENALMLGLSAKKSSNNEDRKGFDRTWAVVRALKASCGRPVRLAIFGPCAPEPGGWEPADLPEDLRAMAGLVGTVPYDELPVYYSGLDYYLCLSRVEGGPYPVLESMACATRVISTPVGVVPELIEDGVNGWIVDEPDLPEKIVAIVQAGTDAQDAARMGSAARETIVSRHALDQVIRPEFYHLLYETARQEWAARPGYDRLRDRLRVVRNRWRGAGKPATATPTP